VTAGQKAGQQLEDHFQEYFSDSVKPAPTTPEQWAATRKLSEMQVHLVMAYIAQFQKNDTAAEAELKKVLTVDPTQASASYQLGSIILHEMATTKDVSRYPEAIYELARSVAVTGANALTAQLKTSANTSLQKNYSNYHGSTDGLDDLIKLASASPLPPSGFHIESVVEIQAAKEKDHAAWAAAHPDLDFWETIRSALVAQGDAYFSNLKDVGFPPPVGDSYKGPAMFRAKVVSQPTPKEILVNVDGIPTGDAILKLDDNVKGDIPAGTDIQFKGVVDSYTKDPYVLTMNIQEPKTDITGLPDDIKFVPDGAAKPKPAGRGGKAGTKAGTKATKKAQ
jgi:hypothetical protein